MQYEIDGKFYPVEVVRKVTNRNTYLRVKPDLTIYVTTNFYTRDRVIQSFIQKNEQGIKRMIERQEKKNLKNGTFSFLGQQYDVVYWAKSEVQLGVAKVFLPKEVDLESWYRKQARQIFKEHLDQVYAAFLYEVPYPRLRIRQMRSRWGVCNTRDQVVTLNLELIKHDVQYLDYVIVHELAHFLYPNHSSDFWKIVENNMPNYKKLRKEMKEF